MAHEDITALVDNLRATDPAAAAMLDKMIAEVEEQNPDALSRSLENTPEMKAFAAKRAEVVEELFAKCDPGLVMDEVRKGASPMDAVKLYAAHVTAVLFTAYDMGAHYVQTQLLHAAIERDGNG